MLRLMKGDLFESDCDALGHGCNCQGKMGAGVALEFKRRFPAMFTEYRRLCADGGFSPGDVYIYRAPDPASPAVLNLATQPDLGGARLEHIDVCCEKIVQNYEHWNIKKLGLPRIGSGLGGLLWRDIRPILEAHFAGISLEVVVFHQ